MKYWKKNDSVHWESFISISLFTQRFDSNKFSTYLLLSIQCYWHAWLLVLLFLLVSHAHSSSLLIPTKWWMSIIRTINVQHLSFAHSISWSLVAAFRRSLFIERACIWINQVNWWQRINPINISLLNTKDDSLWAHRTGKSAFYETLSISNEYLRKLLLPLIVS